MTGSELDILADKIASRLLIQPRWLKLKQAAIYSGIGQKELVSMAKNQKIIGFQDLSNGKKPWLFDKASLDAYRMQQYEQTLTDDVKKIAFDIVNSLEL